MVLYFLLLFEHNQGIVDKDDQRYERSNDLTKG